jgi:hypothetical protein
MVILAGSDRRPVVLPADARHEHPLSGYKGVDVVIGGRTLVETVIDRVRATGCFDPVYLVGPAAAYGRIPHVALIDADGSFGENIETALRTVSRAHPGSPVAFITCDILPSTATLCELLADYDRQPPCDLWFPLVRAPQDRQRLGVSAWKPGYRVVPAAGQAAVNVLPGHLVLVDPAALRVEFVCRLGQLAYRTRNRPINYRRTVLVRGLAGALLYQDLRHLLAGRAPNVTWSVLTAGIAAARKLKAGTILRSELEDALRKIFITARHRKRNPDRRVRLPIVEALSLALDIDTEEEARAAGGSVESRSA